MKKYKKAIPKKPSIQKEEYYNPSKGITPNLNFLNEHGPIHTDSPPTPRDKGSDKETV